MNEEETEVDGQRVVNGVNLTGNNNDLVDEVDERRLGSQSEASVNRRFPLRSTAV